MNKVYIAALFIIGIAVGFTMWAFTNSVTPYVDVQTALKSDKTVQVRGKILHKPVDGLREPYFDQTLKALRFWVEDDKKQRIEVVYRGAKPDAFDTAPETAATGSCRHQKDGTTYFDSDSIVVKCPSKYDDKQNPYQPAAPKGGV